MQNHDGHYGICRSHLMNKNLLAKDYIIKLHTLWLVTLKLTMAIFFLLNSSYWDELLKGFQTCEIHPNESILDHIIILSLL